MVFFFNDTATTEIYTLSLHDALPIWRRVRARAGKRGQQARRDVGGDQRIAVRGGVDGLYQQLWTRVLEQEPADRKSTRLNSSHANISYAVFCLKKKLVNMSKSLLFLH